MSWKEKVWICSQAVGELTPVVGISRTLGYKYGCSMIIDDAHLPPLVLYARCYLSVYYVFGRVGYRPFATECAIMSI
jgi:hypothetical protein